MELIFFALGGVIPKKQWKEKALLCSEVYAEVQINERIFTLQRNITDNSQEGMRIFEGKYENFLIKESLHFPFNSNANANKESFHDNLLSLLGIPKSKSDNSNSINFNQILRLIYTDQLTSVSRIFREQEFDSNLIREAIGDLLLGISSGELLSKKIEFKNLNKKLDTAIDEVKIVLRISGEILTKEHFQEQIENNKIHIDKLNELLEKIDDDIPDTDKEKIIEYRKLFDNILKEKDIKEVLDSKIWLFQKALMEKAQALQDVIGIEQFDDFNQFDEVLKKALKQTDIKLDAKEKKQLLDAITWKNPEAEPVINKVLKQAENPLYGQFSYQGKVVEFVQDGDLRDAENIALNPKVSTTELIEDYFKREVQPHVADAWINADKRDEKDGEIGIVGYEIPFNRHFYVYQPPRDLAEIDADLDAVSREIMALLQEVHS